MSNNIDLYIQELEDSKVEIKRAIIAKGVTPTGGLSSYADAVKMIPTGGNSKMLPLSKTITENGEYEYNPVNDGVDGYSRVSMNVDIPIPTFETQSKEVTIKKNGTTSIVPDSGYDGLSKVDVTVQVATGGSDKPQIFNGFRFTGGDIAQVDFSQYDWSLVYDTSHFFEECSHSTGDWSNFEENFNGEVLSGSYMFSECGSISTIPQMDTSNVTDMSYMFGWCTSLISIPQLDTSKVTNMDSMFGFCSSLTTIPHFNTSKVTNMAVMFNGCSKLTSIPQLVTSNVTSMGAMFKGCSRLTTIPQLDTSKVTNMDSMFQNCTDLTTIPQLVTSNVTSMSSMFYNCAALTTIPQLDTSKVTNMSSMFYNCAALTTIPQLDTSKVTSMSSMFYNCDALTTIPQLDTSNVTNMSNMFDSCGALTSVPQLNTSKVTGMNKMFQFCNKLTELPDFNCVKITTFGTFASTCWISGIRNIEKMGVVDCDSVTNIGYFFGDGQSKLTEFGGCRNLGKASSVSNTNSNYFMNYAPNLTYESVMNVINGLYDRASAGLSVLTLKLHANHLAMLSDDDIAIATNKGWTIV